GVVRGHRDHAPPDPNSRGTRLLYHVRTPGLSRVALSSDRSGGLRVRARGRGLDLSGANRPAITTVLGFGPDQFESTNVFRAIGARLRFREPGSAPAVNALRPAAWCRR